MRLDGCRPCVRDATIMGRITGIMNLLPIIRRSIEGDHLLPWLVIFLFRMTCSLRYNSKVFLGHHRYKNRVLIIGSWLKIEAHFEHFVRKT
jgi:hypothetical protein